MAKKKSLRNYPQKIAQGPEGPPAGEGLPLKEPAKPRTEGNLNAPEQPLSESGNIYTSAQLTTTPQLPANIDPTISEEIESYRPEHEEVGEEIEKWKPDNKPNMDEMVQVAQELEEEQLENPPDWMLETRDVVETWPQLVEGGMPVEATMYEIVGVDPKDSVAAFFGYPSAVGPEKRQVPAQGWSLFVEVDDYRIALFQDGQPRASMYLNDGVDEYGMYIHSDDPGERSYYIISRRRGNAVWEPAQPSDIAVKVATEFLLGKGL
jgi:hypothetical protein